MAELQWLLHHPNPHMNTGDTIQIEVPDFDPDIDKVLPTTTDQDTNDPVTQGSVTPTLKSAEKVIKCRTPAPSHQDIDTQEVDWPDAIPVEIPPQPDQQIEQSIPTQPTQRNPEPAEIPQLEENSEEEQYQDLETYLTHHNMFKASHFNNQYLLFVYFRKKKVKGGVMYFSLGSVPQYGIDYILIN